MTINKEDPTFIRRKFTITETLDGVLTEMAAQNYQDNVSLCLRASIEDHRATLEGTGTDQLASQRLAMKLETIEKQQELIGSTVESVQEQTEEGKRSGSGKRRRNTGEMTDDMRYVYDTVQTADRGLRIGDLVERLDLSASRLQPALGSLVDVGLVVDTGDSTHRFQLAGYTSCNDRPERL